MTDKKIELIIDNRPFPWEKANISEQELRNLAGLPENVQIFQQIPGKPDELILPGAIISLENKGPERFSTQAADSGAGSNIPLLTSSDYECLNKRGLNSEEESNQRFLILKDYQLPKGIYNVEKCNILITIPNNYPDAGNDMFWVHPELYRTNGQPIPAAFRFGGGDARHYKNAEYCRWSRHWDNNQRWNPAKDGISTIINRLTWCLQKPDCK